MTDTRGTRGGTVHSLGAARSLHKQHKDEVWETVIGCAREALRRLPEVHADDISDQVPPDSRTVIGSVMGVLVRRGEAVEVGRRASSHAATHGRKSGVYRAGPQLAGVGSTAGTDTASTQAADPGDWTAPDTRGRGMGMPSASQAGSAGNNQQRDDVPAEPLPPESTEQLSLADVAQAQSSKRRPGHLDLDQREAA